MSKIEAIKATQDFFGPDMQRFGHVVARFETLARRFAFAPVATPIFELTEVFARSLGETTDVVSKEMYTFEDRGGRSVTLRPEYTAGIARAYLSNGWQQYAPMKLFAHGPMFRYEQPQKGRFRQFHQIDAEVLGAAEPQADAEIIALAALLLEDLGLADKVVLNLNTLGDSESRAAYRSALVEYFTAHRASLSKDSVERLAKNPLRILDSKDAGDRALVKDAPVIDSYLTSSAADFFAQVTRQLDTMDIKHSRNPRLVRGLDYYSHTAFEFITSHLGAQGTVIGGGRYDGLMEQMGGPHTPCVGFAGGIERLAMLIDTPVKSKAAIAIVPMGEAAELAGLKIGADLRRFGFAVEQGFKGNMKKRMGKAADAGAPAVLIIGDAELAQGAVMLKDMTTGDQNLVAISALFDALKKFA
jgi:histidyl-tRNA synthetase